MRGILGIILFISSSASYSQCDAERETHYFREQFSLLCQGPRLYYVGGNYKNYWASPQGEWGRFFATSKPGFNFYVGWRIFPFIAVELGYEWTADRLKGFEIPPNTSLLGITNTSGITIGATGKARFKTGALDFNFFYPIPVPFYFDWCRFTLPEAFFTIGVGATQPKIQIHMTPPQHETTTPVPLRVTEFTSQFVPTKGRSKAIFRIGFGFQTLITDILGIRAIWRYETTSLLRARYTLPVTAPATRKIWGNEQSLAVGFFFLY